MNVNEDTSIDISLNWDDVLGANISQEAGTAISVSDAFILSLSNLARVDIEYIMELTEKPYELVVSELRGSIYQNPERWDEDPYLGWESAEEYLSGNLRRKIKAARKANKIYGGRFRDNVISLKKLLPDAVSSQDIYVTLGSPWVPTDIITDFIVHILRMKKMDITWISTRHDEYTGTWEIVNKRWIASRYSVPAHSTFGTSRIDALEILERALNMKTVTVYDEVQSALTSSGKKRVVNQAETVLALDKQKQIIAEFQKWVWKDENRKERLETIFDSKYGCVRKRNFDGSFLNFPGLSKNIKLYPHQKNAVARILFSSNTLLAHDVGSGKTYVMIVAGMELKRMGLSCKNMYVVPNNIVLQWKAFFDSLYPDSNVFCVDAKNFAPEKRSETLKKIKNFDWDAVIIAYSCFERIPLSKKFLLQELQEAKAEISAIENDRQKLTAGLKRKKAQLAKEIAELYESIEAWDTELTFDDLEITRLFVDEAHNFKNVPIETKADKVLGISSGGSKKCKDMMDKVHYIQKVNNGGGVVLATGTPITNSITDVFVMQQYLQSGELAMLDLQTFDSWIGMFAERITDFEVDVDTNSYRLATRFSRFHNLPELTSLLASIADFHKIDEFVDIPAFDGYTDSLIARTRDFAKYLEEISSRAEDVRDGKVDRKDDNMLKITTDGRKAALDLRLVNEKSSFTYQSKVAKCAENVYNIYKATKEQRSTQLVFCDSSTPKDGFNIYDELKRLLLLAGIPENEIEFVHNAVTEQKRAKLFARVRSGEIRILLGSTFKLGMGVNVQDKLIAVHHLDVPWRPADMTQREGRILRQGNQNGKVFIYRYITEGSFDAYSWQLLETKQRFISELLEGSMSYRSGDDVENTVLSYAEVKALAIGNPLVKKRVETANELTRILALHRKGIEANIRLEKELLEIPSRINHQRELIEQCRADIRWYRTNRRVYDKEERRRQKEILGAAIKKYSEFPGDEDIVIMGYHGFEIVIPENMNPEKPYIWVQHEGRYYIELGESEAGAFVRIDNFFDKFSERMKILNETLTALEQQQTALEQELANKYDYTEIIEDLKQRLEKIDKKLGVNKK